MKSLVMITNSLNGGGSQRVFVNLANALCSRYRVSILVLRGKASAYPLDPAIEVYYCPERGKLNGMQYHVRKNFSMLYRIWWCRGLKKKLKPDVSVSSLPYSNLVNAFSRGSGRVIVREGSDPAAVGRKHYWKEWIAMLLADHVVFQSRQVRGYFPDRIRRKSRIIMNPVQVSTMASKQRNNRIVAVGKLTEQKNHRLLMDAFAEFDKVHPGYRLDIYGQGQLESVLKAYRTELHLDDRILFHGFEADIHEAIRDARMFVLSSDFEGLSNALLEAMMMGIACISTRVAGSTEVIESMQNGILVDVGDIQGLTKAMLMLAENEALRERLERNALATSERFRTERIVQEWEAFL